MKVHHRFRIPLLSCVLFLFPIFLCLLFSFLKHDRRVMDLWVYGVMGPLEQFWGRLWSVLPISGMELWIAGAIIGSLVWVSRALFFLLRKKELKLFFRRMLSFITAWLWVLAAFNWLWNAAYYASTFSQRSGLEAAPYSVEELVMVTTYFAENTARLSVQVPRDEAGNFSEPLKECFRRAPSIYKNLAEEFPCLEMKSIQAKPIFFSRLQSILGFTGMYFPFTGEANVNVDAPNFLVPSTIAHEMAHQRMVASEQEANFVGIAAAITSDDVIFQYSGYLAGLIQSSNALYSVAPQVWTAIAQYYFTPELSHDWDINYNYWDKLSSPVEDAAEQTYDSFLKSNDQTLGIRSYGACVDLLVTYFSAKI